MNIHHTRRVNRTIKNKHMKIFVRGKQRGYKSRYY